MNKSRIGGIAAVFAAITVTFVIVPSAVGPGAVSEVSSRAASAVVTVDADDPESAEVPPPARVAIATAPFGRKLTDAPGRTLYVFSEDGPGKSTCIGACARVWSPARSLGGKPQPGPGVEAPSVGNIQRPDGSEQMTFNGHPLYYYGGDRSAGQSNGHGRSEFGGQWSAQPPPKSAGLR
ncbi:MAG TPA: hypothetical protein VEX88_07645 [Glaciibacter sp.]|nr:hypothetical protein [Glaciibacter sp.]